MFNPLTRFIGIVFALCLFLCVQAFAAYDVGGVTGKNSATGEISTYGENNIYGKWNTYADRAMVKKFDNFISARILTNYSYVAFHTSEYNRGTLKSNRPIDFGIGFGLSDFTFDMKYSLPFTTEKGRKRSAGFDTGLDFFPGNLWMQLKYRRYSGLSSNKKIDEIDSDDSTGVLPSYVDFRQRDMYLSILWVKAGKDHFSVRAPYFLDRIQVVSAGSPVFGTKFQSITAVDRSHAIDYYSKTRDTYSVWAHGGYSYTWVFTHNLFVNAWAMGGLALGAFGNGSMGFFPDFNGKLALGQWHQQWSWNAVMQVNYSPSIYSDHTEQRLIAGFEILVVKRF